jgi:hypothetical protein
MHMTTTSKRFILAGVVVLLVVVALIWAAPSSGGRYLARSAVIPSPYTSAFFARTFETHVIETIPGVLRLRVVPRLSAIPGSGIPVLTNGVVIQIIAVGLTAEDAQRAANEAATRVCQTVLTNYGATGEISDQANSARRYSYFHDSFQPGIARLFKH